MNANIYTEYTHLQKLQKWSNVPKGSGFNLSLGVQGPSVARCANQPLFMHQLQPYLDSDSLGYSGPYTGNLTIRVPQCIVCGATLAPGLKAPASTKYSSSISLFAFSMTSHKINYLGIFMHIALALKDLHWLLISYPVSPYFVTNT